MCVFRKFFKITKMPELLFFSFIFYSKILWNFFNLLSIWWITVDANIFLFFCKGLFELCFPGWLERGSFFRTIYLDIASIKIYYSSLAGRSYFFVAVRECQLPSGVPSAGYKPDAIVRSTILGRTAHNISHSHHPPTLYCSCAPSSFAARDRRKSGTGTELTF